MPDTDDDRAAIEKLRGKVVDAIEKLEDKLDQLHHDKDCVLRCFEFIECPTDHSCRICREYE